MLALPAPTAARCGGVLAAAGYALLAGWGVPAQRTLWMLVTVALLRSAGLHWPAPLVLLAAAGVVTLLDPWAVMQPGFWLSFVAVGLLMASEPVTGRTVAAGTGRARQWVAALRRGLRTQAVASDRPGAAEPGVLPAGVAGRLHRQSAGHSAGHAGDRAAGAAGHRAAAVVGAGQRSGAGAGRRAGAAGGMARRSVDGRCRTKLGRGSRPAGRRAAGHAAAVATAGLGPALAVAAAGTAAAAAGAGRVRGARRRHRPGHGGAGAHPHPPAAVRRRAALFGRGRRGAAACCCRCCARAGTTVSTCSC